MRNHKSKVIVISALILVAIVISRPNAGIEPLADSEVDSTLSLDGTTFKLLTNGQAYRVDDATGKWHFHDTVYDPAAMAAAYEQVDGQTFRRDPESEQRFAVRREFVEGFEDLEPGRTGLRQLIGPDRGWGSITLQTPQTPTVQSYVDLRQKILADQSNFLDAMVAPDDTRCHTGKTSLLCQCPPRTRAMVTCKASLSTPLMYFRKGDDVWIRCWFYAEGSRPAALLDLECEWLQHHGGIRLFIDEAGRLLAELKALNKPKYEQPSAAAIVFPLDRWVEVKAHFHLSDDPSGQVQIWQDGVLIVDGEGVTLPLPRLIYSSLEIGITSHSYGDQESRLWVDDLHVSSQELP
jgi:hypothetical protein